MKKKSTAKWIFGVIGKRARWILLLITLLGIFSAFLVTFSALITEGLVNTATIQGDLTKYFIYYGLYILILVLINIGQSYFTVRLQAKLDIGLRQRILKDVMNKDYKFVSKYHSGDILSRATTDTAVLSGGIINAIPQFLSISTRIISAFCLLAIMDWQFAVVLGILAPITIIMSSYYGRLIKRYHLRVQHTESNTRSFMTEAVQNMTVIRAMSNENPIYDYFAGLQNKNFDLRMKLNIISIIANVIMFISVSLLYYLALMWGAYRLSEGLILYGTLTAILQLIIQFQTPFKSLSGVINQYYRMLASGERIMELDNLPQSNSIATNTKENFIRIEIENLSFAYDTKLVINNLNAVINKGELVAIIGESGAGKTTLLKLIIGLLQGNSGEINIVGDNGDFASSVYGLVSYVPQGNMILSGSIRDNICFLNKNISDELVQNALYLCCLDEHIKSLPNGVDTLIGEKGAGLSEGQVQRLAIARALVMGKKILLLDEATSALDETTEAELFNRLMKEKEYTIILVTHHTNLMAKCDKLIKLN